MFSGAEERVWIWSAAPHWEGVLTAGVLVPTSILGWPGLDIPQAMPAADPMASHAHRPLHFQLLIQSCPATCAPITTHAQPSYANASVTPASVHTPRSTPIVGERLPRYHCALLPRLCNSEHKKCTVAKCIFINTASPQGATCVMMIATVLPGALMSNHLYPILASIGILT